MVGSFDIFKIDPIGNLVWRDSAESLAAAQSTVARLSTRIAGKYLIFDQSTQQKVLVDITPAEPAQVEEPRAAAAAAGRD